ncbi:hypothetical protein FVEN_g12099 [Fusarium venenatum]|nr:hypothetical protein FVEN_g12099 [Fusarium venenatum]
MPARTAAITITAPDGTLVPVPIFPVPVAADAPEVIPAHEFFAQQLAAPEPSSPPPAGFDYQNASFDEEKEDMAYSKLPDTVAECKAKRVASEGEEEAANEEAPAMKKTKSN